MEIQITLHTPAGDVTTCYPVRMQQAAIDLITSYLKDGKHFTVQTSDL